MSGAFHNPFILNGPFTSFEITIEQSTEGDQVWIEYSGDKKLWYTSLDGSLSFVYLGKEGELVGRWPPLSSTLPFGPGSDRVRQARLPAAIVLNTQGGKNSGKMFFKTQDD